MKLFICEKPAQARDIARNLNASKKYDGYLEGNHCQVTWCIGHLLELAPPEYYRSDIKPWRLEKLPIIPDQWEYLVSEKTKKQFNVIKSLLKKTDHVVIATDPDREGQAIGEEVLRKCLFKGKVERLWLSALDDSSIQKALKNIRPNSEVTGLYESARSRSSADWLLGMNNTMALTVLHGSGNVLSVGRVQTPTLKLVVDRDLAIENFKSKDYFLLKIHFSTDDQSGFWTNWKASDALLDEDGHCLDKESIEGVFSKVNGKSGVIQHVKEAQKRQKAPLCFSLSTLQKTASAFFGYSAKQVLDIAQSLYERHKATTYPRTDCNYLPIEQFEEVKKVLKTLSQIDSKIASLVMLCDLNFKSTVWNNEKITAHHAIIPTFNEKIDIHKMSQDEFNIYDLIRRQYIAQFLGDYKYLQKSVEVACENELFTTIGSTPIQLGWKQAFNRHPENEEDEIDVSEVIPNLTEQMKLKNQETKIDSKKTKPPARFTEGTLIEAMKTVGKLVKEDDLKKILKESSGIGTEATRANILETLFKRGYIERRNKQVVSTQKGRLLINIVPGIMKNPILTAQWEAELEKIAIGKSSFTAFIQSQSALLQEMLSKLIDSKKRALS